MLVSKACLHAACIHAAPQPCEKQTENDAVIEKVLLSYDVSKLSFGEIRYRPHIVCLQSCNGYVVSDVSWVILQFPHTLCKRNPILWIILHNVTHHMYQLTVKRFDFLRDFLVKFGVLLGLGPVDPLLSWLPPPSRLPFLPDVGVGGGCWLLEWLVLGGCCWFDPGNPGGPGMPLKWLLRTEWGVLGNELLEVDNVGARAL